MSGVRKAQAGWYFVEQSPFVLLLQAPTKQILLVGEQGGGNGHTSRRVSQSGVSLVVGDTHPSSPPRSLELGDGLPHPHAVAKVRASAAHSSPGLLPRGSLWTPVVLFGISSRRRMSLFLASGALFSGAAESRVVSLTCFFDDIDFPRPFLPQHPSSR